MSVALAGPPIAVYREEQNFAWWLYALLLSLVLLGFGAWQSQREPVKEAIPALKNLKLLEVPLFLMVVVAAPAALTIGFLRMTTEVNPAEVMLWYGWVPTFRRSIPLSEIDQVEVVSYSAWQDHGFWGVRQTADSEFVFTARGDQGVRLFMADGSKILIGTQRPDELAATLRSRIQGEG